MKRCQIFTMSCGLVAVILLGGCSGGSGRSGSSSTKEPSEKAARALTVSRDNPCSVLFPTEVGEILGVPSNMREITDEITCHYHFEPVNKDQSKIARTETFIEVKIHWTDGRAAITAVRLAGKLLDPGAGAFEKLSGIGDEAWLAPFASYLAFVKGPVGVEIDMRMMPGEREKAIRLAQRIASRL